MEKNIGKDMSPKKYQNNGQHMQPNYGTAPPHQPNPMKPGHGNAQPYQVGVSLAVSADGGGPVPQVSEQQLAQMAKNKWFRFENGTWILKQPRGGLFICSIIITVIVILAFAGAPVGAYFVFDSYYPLAGLTIPLILICLFAYTGGSTTMIFDDREGTVYYKTTRMSCCSKESIIKYSDCVGINAVLRTRISSNQTSDIGSKRRTTYYSYSLVTLDGNYEMLSKYDNLDEVSLNAFLRERLASTGTPGDAVSVEVEF